MPDQFKDDVLQWFRPNANSAIKKQAAKVQKLRQSYEALGNKETAYARAHKEYLDMHESALSALEHFAQSVEEDFSGRERVDAS